MMNSQQVVNTTPNRGLPAGKAAYWVAAWMLIGLLGLGLIGVIFKKHVEL